MGTMQAIIKEFSDTTKLLKSDRANIGSFCSCLHYTVTSSFIFVCFLLVTSTQHFGSPIHCLMDSRGDQSSVPENVINNYCFISSTYSVVSKNSKGDLSRRYSQAYPGVQTETQDSSVVRHAYYQWVPYTLLLQIAFFMLPHWSWKLYVGNTVDDLVALLDENLEQDLAFARKSKVIQYLSGYFYRRMGYLNDILGILWILCDVLALLNVGLNFWFTDALLGGTFMEYGMQAIKIAIRDVVEDGNFPEEFSTYLPVMTKCTFRKYGPSGSLMTLDSMCILNLNMVNQKIFFALFVWFFILFFLTSVAIFVKLGRVMIFKYYSPLYWEGTIGAPVRYGQSLKVCASAFKLGDFVLLHLVAKNMRPLTYLAFVDGLALKILESHTKIV